jgi:hypothetical protein
MRRAGTLRVQPFHARRHVEEGHCTARAHTDVSRAEAAAGQARAGLSTVSRTHSLGQEELCKNMANSALAAEH